MWVIRVHITEHTCRLCLFCLCLFVCQFEISAVSDTDVQRICIELGPVFRPKAIPAFVQPSKFINPEIDIKMIIKILIVSQ